MAKLYAWSSSCSAEYRVQTEGHTGIKAKASTIVLTTVHVLGQQGL